MLLQELKSYVKRLDDYIKKMEGRNPDTEYGKGLKHGSLISSDMVKCYLDILIKEYDKDNNEWYLEID